MSWNLYLPLAGNSTNILLLFGLGGAVGFLSGLFGRGGRLSHDAALNHGGDSFHRGRGLGLQPDCGGLHLRLLCPLPPGERGLQDGPLPHHRRGARGHPGGTIHQNTPGHGQCRLRHQDHLRRHAGRHRLLHVFGEPPEHAEKAGGNQAGGSPHQGLPLQPHDPGPPLPDEIRKVGGGPLPPAPPLSWGCSWASWRPSWAWAGASSWCR